MRFTIYLSDELRDQMRTRPDLNWSAVAQVAFAAAIDGPVCNHRWKPPKPTVRLDKEETPSGARRFVGGAVDPSGKTGAERR